MCCCVFLLLSDVGTPETTMHASVDVTKQCTHACANVRMYLLVLVVGLKAVLKQLDIPVYEHQVQVIFDALDDNGDGV